MSERVTTTECACTEPKVALESAICHGCGLKLPTIIITEKEWAGRSLSANIPAIGLEEGYEVVIRTVVDNGRRVGPLIRVPLRANGYTFEEWREVVTLVSRLKAKWESKGG